MTAVYRLYTEDRANLRDIIARYFSGATVFHADGLWLDCVEPAAVIEIIAADDATARLQVHTLATYIACENQQSEVMVLVQSARGLEQLHITPLSAVVVS